MRRKNKFKKKIIKTIKKSKQTITQRATLLFGENNFYKFMKLLQINSNFEFLHFLYHSACTLT